MEEKRLGYPHKRRLMVIKWFIMLLIGIITGLIAVFVDFSVKTLTKFKFTYVQNKLDSCLAEHCLFQPYLAWIAISIALVLVSGFLILWEVRVSSFSGTRDGRLGYFVASGTGFRYSPSEMLSQRCCCAARLAFQGIDCQSVGCHLRCQRWTSGRKRGTYVSCSQEKTRCNWILKIFISRIHAGAIVAGGISQGKSSSLKFDLHVRLIGNNRETSDKGKLRLDFQIFPHG